MARRHVRLAGPVGGQHVHVHAREDGGSARRVDVWDRCLPNNRLAIRPTRRSVDHRGMGRLAPSPPEQSYVRTVTARGRRNAPRPPNHRQPVVGLARAGGYDGGMSENPYSSPIDYDDRLLRLTVKRLLEYRTASPT